MKLEKYNCKLHWLFVSETCENWSQNYSVSVTRVAPSCCCSLIFTWPLYICLCLHQSISESTYLSIPIYLSISLYILRRPVSRSCCYSCTRTHFALSGVVGTYLVKLVSVWPDLGELSPLCQKIKCCSNLLEFGKLLSEKANFQCSKWANMKKVIIWSGHTGLSCSIFSWYRLDRYTFHFLPQKEKKDRGASVS